jgi:hypothetical protein
VLRHCSFKVAKKERLSHQRKTLPLAPRQDDNLQFSPHPHCRLGHGETGHVRHVNVSDLDFDPSVGQKRVYRVPSASRSDNLAAEVFQH